MNDYIIIITLVPGVMMRIPVQFESKHFSTDQLVKAGQLLAKNLGGQYLYWEPA